MYICVLLFGPYLVGLHRLQHTIKTNRNNTNLMALARSWIQIHIRHDILLEVISGSIGGQLDNLGQLDKQSGVRSKENRNFPKKIEHTSSIRRRPVVSMSTPTRM